MREEGRKGSAGDAVGLAVEAIRAGGTIVVYDDEARENEGDLVCAAAHATPEAVNFMVRHGRGLICVPMARERMDALGLSLMTSRNTDPHGTAYTVSVDGRDGVGTGISAGDRSRTITALADGATGEDDFRQPGHVFPLLSRDGGVLVRAGHTEAAVDLCRLAGLPPVGVVCEILRDDGEMMRLPELRGFAAEHGLPLLAIADLIEHRLERHSSVRLLHEIPAAAPGTPRTLLFAAEAGSTPLAWIWGSPDPDRPCLVRVHSETEGDDGHSGALAAAAEMISEAGEGVLVFMRAGHPATVNTGLRAEGDDRQAMFRTYGLGAQVLRACGVGRMRLITNRPMSPVALQGFGLTIEESLPLATATGEGEAGWGAPAPGRGTGARA